MSRSYKWPAKLLNLLVAVALVISLCVVIAPAVVAQSPDPDCERTEQFDGCNLEVFAKTYLKDPVTGAFTPVSEVVDGQCFYVNAVVVNTGNETVTGPIEATLTVTGAGHVIFADCEAAGGVTKMKQWDGDLVAGLEGCMADFWWQVCCDGAAGPETLTVSVAGCNTPSANVYITQTPDPTDPCLYIEIVEAPGWAAPGYVQTFPSNTVVPCTNFGIKALVRNDCASSLVNVNATIDYTSEYASLVGVDPVKWELGDLAPGEERVVGWTLHCDDPGDVRIQVDAEVNDEDAAALGMIDYGDHNYYDVYQLGAGELEVEITSPADGLEVCAACSPDNAVPIAVKVTNNTGEDLGVVQVNIAGNVTVDIFSFTGGTFRSIPSFPAGDPPKTVTFNGVCNAPGPVTLTAEAQGGNLAETEYYVSDVDTVSINQKRLIAEVFPGMVSQVNICETFDLIGAFENCYGLQLVDVDVTVHWKGNATLLFDSPYEPQYNTQQPPPGVWQDYTSVNTVVVDEGNGWYSNTQDRTICQCCECLAKWSFQCFDEADVEYYFSMEWTDTAPEPDVLYTDESAHAWVYQEWKTHIIGGLATFLQDDLGCMIHRESFSPCQNFHVVMPIINTGEATADNVVATFQVLGALERWDFVNVSGDLVSPSAWSFDAGTGIGTATLGTIYGNTMKKAILQLHCAGEGDVDLLLTSVAGTDRNTGASILLENIELPECPITVKQIPFTVEIINPEDCVTYNQNTVFAVKAVIENGSGTDLEDVTALLELDGNAELLQTVGMPVQNNPKTLGNLTAYSTHEITWMVKCTNPGEVDITVLAVAGSENLEAVSQTINVKQREAADIEVEILSPADGTWVATSQEFAVTARVNNTGSVDAENVQVWVERLDRCTVIGDNLIDLGTLAYASSTIVTWTLHADATGSQECGYDEDWIRVNSSTTTQEGELTDNYDTTIAVVYPAAHLVADITLVDPASPFLVCEEFDVDYVVWNTGEADAWEVSATLMVSPEGSVRIAAGDSGYTQYLGTIPGWRGDTGEYVSEGDTFTVHCKQACESTLTIMPMGYDECGFTLVECEAYADWDIGESGVDGPDDGDWHGTIMNCTWNWAPGRAIRDMFIEADSVTVKQLESGQLDLGITKVADKDFAEVEEQVLWTVTVTNYGPTDATGVAVTDVPPGTLTVDDLMVTQGSYAAGVWTVGSLSAGGTATMEILTTVDSAVEITNMAAISAVDQPDGVPGNNEASATINKLAIESVDIDLVYDWNLISLPLWIDPADRDIVTLLAGIEDNVAVVWGYNAATMTWSSYIPDGPPPGLTEMADGVGYWIDMDAADTLTVAGDELPLPPITPPTYSVVTGWNLMGFKSTSAMAAGDYLAAIDGQWTRIYGFANGQYSVVQSGDMMTPGAGFWIAVTSPGTVYP